ncbi:MAG: PEGA domain-containing protein [Clostridiales bacterium]|nr:PEGA domain-containing protein [Clostridiales bacterium]
MGKTSVSSKAEDDSDGVILETTRTPVTPQASLHVEPRPAKRKSSFGYFYVITLFSAVTICIVIFAIVFNTYMINSDRNVPGGGEVPTPSQPTVTMANHATGVLTKINSEDKSVTFLDSSNNLTYVYRPSESTAYKDKYGTPIAFAELKAGDIVDLSLTTSNRITAMAKSSSAWSLPMRKNVAIDMSKKTITTSSVIYEFDSSLQTLWNGLPFDLSQITSVDVVTISGLEQKALVVILEKSHGYVTLSNSDSVTNGFLEIDTTMTSSLSEIAGPLPLAEGLHKIVVRGDNIEPFGKDIEIGPGSDIILDLGTATLKTGTLTLSTNVSDYTAIVDGTLCQDSEIPPLDYGVHTLRVEKDGYIPVEQTFVISSPVTDMQAVLKPIVKLGRAIISTDPERATIYIDSARIGESPVSVPLELGDHTLTVELDGYTQISLPITIDMTSAPFNAFEVGLVPEPDNSEPVETEAWSGGGGVIAATPTPIPSMQPNYGFSAVPTAPPPISANTPPPVATEPAEPSPTMPPEEVEETETEEPEAAEAPFE